MFLGPWLSNTCFSVFLDTASDPLHIFSCAMLLTPMNGCFIFQEQLDPFSLVADELSVLANRLRSMVIAEVFVLFFCTCHICLVAVIDMTFRSDLIIPIWYDLIKFGFKFHSQVPKLASAAEYFFKMGVEGKRFRPTVTAIIPMRSLFGFGSKLCSASVLWVNLIYVKCILVATFLKGSCPYTSLPVWNV